MKTQLVIVLLMATAVVTGKDVNIIDFGANPDGRTLTTGAIQKAIDYCAETGGGTVTVPLGTYLTSSIFLKSNVNLHIQKGATILGSTDPKAFRGGIINADNIQDASITGMGIIDGQGFIKYYPTDGPRHNNILLNSSRNITVKDVTLLNASSWVFRIKECTGIIVHGIRIYSFSNQNNDGIDIDGKDINISGCIIDCEDDAMCLKSDNPQFMVENVTITNCIISSNCNAIKFGTSSRCGFRNISISNCVIRRPSEAGLRNWAGINGVSSDTTVISGIALEVVDGGMMDQVAISNISMTGIQTPLFIRLGSRNGKGTLKNVVISNITATSESMITSSITGIPGSYVENVIVKNVIFNCKGTGTMTEAVLPVPEKEASYPENRMFGYSLPAYGLYVRHVKGLVFEDFFFNLLAPDARPAIVLDDCHNIKIGNFTADPPSGDQPLLRLVQSTNVAFSGYQSITPISRFLRIEGDKSSDIKLSGNDFSYVRTITELSEGSLPSSVKEVNNIKQQNKGESVTRKIGK